MGRLWLHLTLVASATAQTYTWPPQAPPPTPSPPWPPLTPALPLLTVAGTPSGACEVINGGACVTDGAGQHSNNERCTFTNVAGASLTISTYHFNVETGWDNIQMGGVTYSGPSDHNGPQNVVLAAGETFTWYSDSSVTPPERTGGRDESEPLL